VVGERQLESGQVRSVLFQLRRGRPKRSHFRSGRASTSPTPIRGPVLGMRRRRGDVPGRLTRSQSRLAGCGPRGERPFSSRSVNREGQSGASRPPTRPATAMVLTWGRGRVWDRPLRLHLRRVLRRKFLRSTMAAGH
jgi:hypothetical protein